MIFCLTGTGNSRYVANKLAAVTGEGLVNIGPKIKDGDTSPIVTDGRAVFITPTYAWRIPKIAESWILKVDFHGADKAWFVMDCGSEIGNAAKYNARLCADKGFASMGPVMAGLAEKRKSGAPIAQPRGNLYDRLMSSVANPLFYRFAVRAEAFHADDRCIGGGKCAALCPLNNIRREGGKPVWGRNCTHCMACIAYCPTEAIEYGRKSVGKPRYHLD